MNFTFNKTFLEKLALSFARAFIAAFIAGIAGIAAVPNWDAAKALAVAAIVAGLTAGVRAVQHIAFDAPPA